MIGLEPAAEDLALVTVALDGEHQVLVVHADLGLLLDAQARHVTRYHLKLPAEQAALFRRLLAFFALHCATRPATEQLTWTLNFNAAAFRVFLAGDNGTGFVVGRLFPNHPPSDQANVFYSNAVAFPGALPRTSVVTFQTLDAFELVERYYAESEQRTARLFDLGGERYAMLVSHPDSDEAYLRTVGIEAVRRLVDGGNLAPVELRASSWTCTCSHQKILGLIASTAREDLDGAFGGESALAVSCPRCSAVYTVTRAETAAFLAGGKSPG